jgi:membrane associated rhomboid family serine protease
MGIHDRDYYRDGGGRWGAASEHRGVIAIIAITVAVTIASWVVVEPPQYDARGELTDPGSAVLQEAIQFEYDKVVPGGQVWRFVTSFLFYPGGFTSIIWLAFSMWFFYFFGGEMEILYGTRRFLTFYVLAGVLANGVKFALGLASENFRHVVTAGNTAPMYAAMVLFAFHYPHRRINLWFVSVPVWLLVTIYLGVRLLSLLPLARDPSGIGLPWLVEPLVGVLVGFLYYRTRGRIFAFADVLGGLFRRRERRRSPANLRVYDDNAPRPSTRSSSPPPAAVPEPVPQPAGGGVDEHLEAKLDAVLAKVARHGKGSLTAEENDILMRASEVFKKKRR